MKKTLIALMALVGVASAASTPVTMVSPADYDYVVYEGTNLNLTSVTEVEGSAMISGMETASYASTAGYFISNTILDNGEHNGSPGFSKVVLTLNLTDTTGTGNIFSVITGADGGIRDTYRGWGINLEADGALTFARVQASGAITDNKTSLGTLEAGSTYTITIVSNGTKNNDGIVGRGTGNFDISVFNGTTTQTYTANGFGLDGSYLDKFIIGQANGVNGTLSVTAMVPEPATATLSLLALAGLCARRRRG